jgi:hypothetical protein
MYAQSIFPGHDILASLSVITFGPHLNHPGWRRTGIPSKTALSTGRMLPPQGMDQGTEVRGSLLWMKLSLIHLSPQLFHSILVRFPNPLILGTDQPANNITFRYHSFTIDRSSLIDLHILNPRRNRSRKTGPRELEPRIGRRSV